MTTETGAAEAVFAAGIIFEGQAQDMDADNKRRNVACFYNPGDKLRPNPADKRGPSLREKGAAFDEAFAAAGADVLTVKELFIAIDGVENTFNEMPGRWNAGLFTDARKSQSVCGVIVKHDGDYWLVPTDQVDMDDVPNGTPLLLAEKTERHVIWNVGAETAAELADDLGEFYVAEDGAGRHVLVACPMLYGTNDHSLELAREHVRNHATQAAAPVA